MVVPIESWPAPKLASRVSGYQAPWKSQVNAVTRVIVLAALCIAKHLSPDADPSLFCRFSDGIAPEVNSRRRAATASGSSVGDR